MILNLQNIYKDYQQDKLVVPVLKDVCLQVEEGEYVAIMGESGSGKTTLLSLLGGLDTPTKGNILFDDTDIMQTGLEDHRRKHVSLIFQNYNLIDYMTPIENTMLASKVDAIPILRRLGLKENELRRTVLKLSGGQQQRVAIARSLASDAPVILADEPTGNLDETTAAEITKILKESAHEYRKCVIIVTHSDEVARASDCVLEIRHGTLKERK